MNFKKNIDNLLSKYSINQITSIIDYVNQVVYNREKPSKLIDLYKSNSISKYIDEAIIALNIQ